MTDLIAPAAATFRGETANGTGLALPLAKAHSHLMLIHEAHAREWPLSARAATAELREAASHLAGLTYPRTLITAELADELDAWQAALSAAVLELGEDAPTDETTPLSEANRAKIPDLVEKCWALLTLVDREITGLSPTEAEPGRLP